MHITHRVVLAALLPLALVGALAGCAEQVPPPDTTDTEQQGGSEDMTATTDPMADIGSEQVVMKTNKGDIVFVLYPGVAPEHVKAFIKLVKDGFYDGVKIHRVEPGFVVQAGDPQTKDLTSEQVADIVSRQTSGGPKPDDPALGTGGPGFNIDAEFNARPHVKGTLAMARAMDPNSAGSQFYIALAPLPQLDGQYTVFGFTAEGMDVVEKLAIGDTIESATVEPRK